MVYHLLLLAPITERGYNKVTKRRKIVGKNVLPNGIDQSSDHASPHWGRLQSWIVLESSATAFLIWTRGEPVSAMKMKNKYKAKGASMLKCPGFWRAFHCHRYGWGAALHQDHQGPGHLRSRWLGEQEVSPGNEEMAGPSPSQQLRDVEIAGLICDLVQAGE